MTKLRVLFIGGSGVISSACSRVAVDSGMELFVLNRGQSTERPLPPGVTMLRADVREHQTVRDEISGRDFDAVVDWVAFTPGQVRADIDLFRGRTGQYVFISSASAYQTPPARQPVVESTPLRNPFWQYSRDTIASDDLLTWNQIAESLAAAAGCAPDIVHVPSDAIAAADPEWGAGLLGDKAHSMVFDNTKLRSVVPAYRATIPFEQGAREIVAWYVEDPARQRVDAHLDRVMDKLAGAYGPRRPP